MTDKKDKGDFANKPVAKKREYNFKPGKSGNPAGRPKKTQEEYDLIAACRAKVPAALDTMLRIMEFGENERNQLTAAMAIIERAYGKPEQPEKDQSANAITINLVRHADD